MDSESGKTLLVNASGTVAGTALNEDVARSRTPEFAEIGRWVARLEKCGVGELPGVFAEVMALPDGDEKSRALRLLCARWAEVDAAGGFEQLMALKPVQDAAEGSPDMNAAERQARRFLLTEWARRDPAAAFAASGRLEGEERRWARDAVGGGLLDDGPKAFWAWFELARQPVPVVFSEKWRAVLEAHLVDWLAVADGSLKETEESMPCLSHFLELMAKIQAEQNPAKATEWASPCPWSSGAGRC